MTIHIANNPAHTAPAGLLALYATRTNPRDSAAMDAAGNDDGVLQGTPSFRIDLPYMNVILSISADSAVRAPGVAPFGILGTSDGMASDPVIEQLLNQLGQQGSGTDDGAYGDAIRLAVAARWLRLRAQPAPEPQDDPSKGALQKWRLKRVMAYIDDHLCDTISLADLALTAGLSRMYFAARFRTATGLRPHEYILRRRIDRAKDMLTQSNESLVEIAFNVGFQTQAHFTTVFKRFAGVTPGRWRVSSGALA